MDTIEYKLPFDYISDLQDSYEAAQAEGDTNLVRTLDILGLWNEDAEPRWLRRVWWALQDDGNAQSRMGWMFDWSDESPVQVDRDFNNPELAVYWYEKAAKNGVAAAQCNLANLYCGSRLPKDKWNGKLAVYWREQSAAQKEPNGMRGLAHCLTCGRCCEGGCDYNRAGALFREAAEIEKARQESEKGE